MKTMLLIVGGLLCGLPATARARDSASLLCEDGTVALSLYEHRAGADKRETNLRLLYGAYVLLGTLKDGFAGRIKLADPEPPGNFEGTIRIDFAKSKVALKGSLALATGRFTVDAKLACKELLGELKPAP